MKQPNLTFCMSLVISTLCVGCGESDTVDQSQPRKSEAVRSYAEVAKERSDQRDRQGGVPLESDPEHRVLAAGLIPSAAGKPPTSVPTLSEQADRESPVPSRFRLSMARCVEAFEAVSRAEQQRGEDWGVLVDLGFDVDASIFWEMNQLSGDVDFLQARGRLLPARRAWVLSRNAEMQICWNGVQGYFGNCGSEAAAAARSFGFFGLASRAEALDAAIAAMPKTASGAIDWHAYPLPDQTRSAVEKEFDLLCTPAELERAIYALNHPELFFTNAADAFVPEPLPGAKDAK